MLTDFSAYPNWNPFIRSIQGEPSIGSRLKVRIEPPGARGMTVRPTVRALQPARELRWLGRLQSERFRGLLVGLLTRTLAATERGFAQMNDALKRRVEVT